MQFLHGLPMEDEVAQTLAEAERTPALFDERYSRIDEGGSERRKGNTRTPGSPPFRDGFA